ncbi:hypothetical protein CIPAW_05G173600 [Carya illinoinensis]|uniref:Uncharacterized protein n=1 Tax=Carya illinoinensis TaxID=32201 RepID=A0A8T1QKL6_CARIL|nr:hypothetical protein CIPAW_05G173600 [Carya illinoinensis]
MLNPLTFDRLFLSQQSCQNTPILFLISPSRHLIHQLSPQINSTTSTSSMMSFPHRSYLYPKHSLYLPEFVRSLYRHREPSTGPSLIGRNAIMPISPCRPPMAISLSSPRISLPLGSRYIRVATNGAATQSRLQCHHEPQWASTTRATPIHHFSTKQPNKEKLKEKL